MTYALTDLSVVFAGRSVLSNVSLEIPGGAVTAVVGGDGAGKSTLLRCLVGLVAPTCGTVTRPGKEHLGYMPASSGTWRELTVGENLDFVARAYGVDAATLTVRRQRLLERAGLSGVVDRPASKLSGGMRHKLGFCMAMIHSPRLLVLDEPTTGVDVVSRVQLWQLIAEAAAQGAAVLMATTYLDEAERASSVLVLDRGQQLIAGDPAAITASLHGTIVETPHPSARHHAWRRGRAFHEWHPAGEPAAGAPIPVDLEDAVMARMLERDDARQDA